MVPVGMAKHDVRRNRLRPVSQHVATQGTRSGAGIEDKPDTTGGNDLDAGGVAAIANSRGAGRGDGPAGSPKEGCELLSNPSAEPPLVADAADTLFADHYVVRR